MSNIIKRLNDIWRDDDHERGCEGRTYNCTCGFDNRTLKTAEDAAAHIEALERENAELREARSRALNDAWEAVVLALSNETQAVQRRARSAIRRLAEQEGTE